MGCFKVTRIIFVFCAILIGLLPGFFLTLNYLFSDSNSSLIERLMTFSVVLIVYGILGFVFGIMRPKGSWHWGIWLNLAAFILVLIYSFKEPQVILLGLVYLTISFFAASMAAYYGSER